MLLLDKEELLGFLDYTRIYINLYYIISYNITYSISTNLKKVLIINLDLLFLALYNTQVKGEGRMVETSSTQSELIQHSTSTAIHPGGSGFG